MAEQSILTSTKKLLGIEADYTAFDLDIILHINSVFSTLHQIGVGPSDGFMIEDATTNWSSFTSGNATINSVKSYLYLRVRILFDPPATSFAIEAMRSQVRELEWRLNVAVESPSPVVTTTETTSETTLFFTGA